MSKFKEINFHRDSDDVPCVPQEINFKIGDLIKENTNKDEH